MGKIICPDINVWSNVEGLKPNTSLNFIYLPAEFEIRNCQFINISLLENSGSAINIEQPHYKYYLQDPKITIDSCYFCECVSESSPGAIGVDYGSAKVNINKMCALNYGGSIVTIFYISSQSAVNFTSSTINSNSQIAMQFDNFAFSFKCPGRDTSYIRGTNQTKGTYYKAISEAINVLVSYCHYEKLASTSLLNYKLSSIDHCNFIDIKCDFNVIATITRDILESINYSDCIFIRTNYLELFDNRTVPKENGVFEGKYNDLSKYMIDSCDFIKNKKDHSLVIIITTVVISSALVIIVVLATFKVYRKHQIVIEERSELERSIDADFG
ncbi:hypothetical protein TVAG_399450 [Trichomonas vaginalis G3]|uniref:Surface antigen BspA-like n=1 Tax=Trichomonas vaginalis (strain ATCC PRA-98 / G3) TaxID=412133 RepID=A2E5Y3_TRIV3|nr:hypothetical protein TVAGG3_0337610 [Trichomonas vaginalis G3]EAY11940.1 hypothetical protein TVAG_399450 [Trichomonas vaginalis G3]KAI5530395.1 hypothetical protein TVAGG3_0337610 [Trichomonas vaginalis G3]|eukprot:XP_001324163.1 hypothetical protein [Trichomonas vaginalis G3]